MKKTLITIFALFIYLLITAGDREDGWKQFNHKSEFNDTIELNKPIIFPDGDTIIFFMYNDSLNANVNGDTINIQRGSGTSITKENIVDSVETVGKLNLDTLNSDNYTDGTYNYTLNNLKNDYYTVDFYGDLPTTNDVAIGSKGYVNYDEKEYIYNGFNWVNAQGNIIILNDKHVEQFYTSNLVTKSETPIVYTSGSGNTVDKAKSGTDGSLYYFIVDDANVDTNTTFGGTDVYVYRVVSDTANGVIHYGSSAADNKGEILDLNDGNFMILGGITNNPGYIEGKYVDTLTIDNRDIFSLILDSNYAVVDSATIFLTGSDFQIMEDASVSPDGNVFFQGFYKGESYYNNYQDTLADAANFTPFYGKVNQNGVIQWIKAADTSYSTSNRIYDFAYYGDRIYFVMSAIDTIIYDGQMFIPDANGVGTYILEIDPDDGSLINYSAKIYGNGGDLFLNTLLSDGEYLYTGGYTEVSTCYLFNDSLTGETAFSLVLGKITPELDSTLWFNGFYTGEHHQRVTILYENLIIGGYHQDEIINENSITISDLGGTRNVVYMMFDKYTGELKDYYRQNIINNTDATKPAMTVDKSNNDLVFFNAIDADTVITIDNDTIDLTGVNKAVYMMSRLYYPDSATSVIGIGDQPVYIGNYRETNNYVVYNDSSLKYSSSKSSYSGNEIPSMTAVQNEISDIDSSWQKSSHDTINGNSSDTININATTKFEAGIRANPQILSFSVSMDASFLIAHERYVTITNNVTSLTASDIPDGIAVRLWITYSGGDYTISLSGITQMSGNSTISLQETDGAKDLMQFTKDPITGTIYYTIINVVTP